MGKYLKTTDSKIQEVTDETLRQSSQKWQAIIAASPDGIGIAGLDGKLLFASDKLAKMYGYSLEEKDEFIGSRLLDFIDPSYHQVLTDNFGRLINGRIDDTVSEYLAIKKDKKQVLFRSEFNVVA